MLLRNCLIKEKKVNVETSTSNCNYSALLVEQSLFKESQLNNNGL